jgi:hypothetical protein
MAIKLKLIASVVLAMLLFLLYLAFFTPEIKQMTVSESISLEALLKNEN